MKNAVLILIAVCALYGAVLYGQSSSRNAGSVAVGGTYKYKSVTSANASATVPVVVHGGRSTLGSIIVLGTSTVAVRVYDSASATSSATLIATLPLVTAQGTYTYDMEMTNGIVLDVPAAYAGNLIVTHR